MNRPPETDPEKLFKTVRIRVAEVHWSSECDGERCHYCRDCGALTCMCAPCRCPEALTIVEDGE